MSHKNISILFIISFAAVTLGEQASCQYKRRGANVILRLKYGKLEKGDHLTWRKDGVTVFERKKGQVKIEKKPIISNGSLELTDLKTSDDGLYEEEVYNSIGISHKSEAIKICVIEAVTKPTVVLSCSAASLTCSGVEPSTKPSFSWQENKENLPDKTSKIQLPKQRKHSKFSCTAKNQISEETSDEVEINCQDPHTLGQGGWTLPGFDFLATVLILAGGGALLLILVVVIVVCICRRQRHERKLLRDEEELRLANLTHSQQAHPPGHQTVPAKTYAGPCGHTLPEDRPPALPKPRAQSRPRPPHPRAPPEDQEHPPPRPKPRKGPRPQRS